MDLWVCYVCGMFAKYATCAYGYCAISCVRVCACAYGSCACFCSITHFLGIWCVRPFLACICEKPTTVLRDTTKTTKLISITILWMRIILCIHNLKCEMPNLLAELKRSGNCAKCFGGGGKYSGYEEYTCDVWSKSNFISAKNKIKEFYVSVFNWP